MSSSVTAFVLGYTGETGKALLKQLSGDNYFSNIVLIGRRQVDLGDLQIADDGRFTQRVIDFDEVEKYADDFKGCDVGFCCMGTTRGKGGAAHFVKVDRDYVVNSAKVAKDAGCSHFQVVTAYGADKNSSILYNKTKGEVEEQLKNINFQRLSIFQPALLLGKREESRPLETFFKVISFPFTKLFPTLGSVHFDVLARAMIYNTKQQTSEKVEVIDNRKIHELSKLAK
ncbi:oxidoreductase HTATIP2-like isoform X1 [Mercenaria mercenaria]|uniref:oxidoreductase HTATIP2-like isoform X1 n=1 Tax=Mercenaria mercenaria TaxID=6596 RepID=UPI00234E4A65|nr:oxidoreductase HTATIP2-like isoform X1 [Mercenaria mercenaria]